MVYDIDVHDLIPHFIFLKNHAHWFQRSLEHRWI